MVKFFYYYDHVPLHELTHSVSELIQVASISMFLSHVRACDIVNTLVKIQLAIDQLLTIINMKRCHCAVGAR